MHVTKYTAIVPAATQESRFLDVSREQLRAPKACSLVSYKSWAKDVMIHNRIFDRKRQEELDRAKATLAPKRRPSKIKPGVYTLDQFLDA
jgi:hypothetical protein